MGRHRISERLARFRKRRRAGFPTVVSEGDSWFSYEFYPNIVDLLDDAEMFAHLRLEMSGDTVQNMVGDRAALDGLRSIVLEEEPLFVLFSGGGNDMQNDANGLFRDGATPEECLVADRADRMFGMLAGSYEELIDAVGDVAPLVAHGYDYFQPKDAPIRLAGFDIGLGPWFHGEMEAVGITEAERQLQVAKVMVDRFNADLAELQSKHRDAFVHIDLRGTLETDRHWENEIHPTREGFELLTQKVLTEISTDVRRLIIDRAE